MYLIDKHQCTSQNPTTVNVQPCSLGQSFTHSIRMKLCWSAGLNINRVLSQYCISLNWCISVWYACVFIHTIYVYWPSLRDQDHESFFWHKQKHTDIIWLMASADLLLISWEPVSHAFRQCSVLPYEGSCNAMRNLSPTHPFPCKCHLETGQDEIIFNLYTHL